MAEKGFKEYRSKAKVQARKITDDEETVITRNGATTGRKGQYVVLHVQGEGDNATRAFTLADGEEFESEWETTSSGNSGGNAPKKSTQSSSGKGKNAPKKRTVPGKKAASSRR